MDVSEGPVSPAEAREKAEGSAPHELPDELAGLGDEEMEDLELELSRVCVWAEESARLPCRGRPLALLRAFFEASGASASSGNWGSSCGFNVAQF